MDSLERFLYGKTAKAELRRRLAFKAVVFWGLLFLVWQAYPKQNQYSIMTHTVSFLGSYENYHNPRWWWLFSLALLFLGMATVPLVFYAHRRFASISRRSAHFGALLMLVGCLGVMCVGLFPEGQARIISDFKTTHGHMLACILMEVGFGLGIAWHTLLLLFDRIFNRNSAFKHSKFILPYAFLGTALGPFAYFLLAGQFIFPIVTSNPSTPALHTVHSFPLWEHLAIYSMIIFIDWFILVLPEDGQNQKRVKAPKDLNPRLVMVPRSKA